MKRVIGFALFSIALGMLIMLFLPHKIVGVVLLIICMLVGYNLFCC